MPKALEEKLMKAYRKRGFTGERLNHAVYGTMNKIETDKKKKAKKK